MLSLSLPIRFYGAKMYHACFWRRKEIIRLIQPPTLWITKISYWWNIGTNPMRVPLSDSIEKPCQKMKPIYSIVLEFRNLYLDFSYYRLVQPTNLIRKTSFFIIQGLQLFIIFKCSLFHFLKKIIITPFYSFIFPSFHWCILTKEYLYNTYFKHIFTYRLVMYV